MAQIGKSGRECADALRCELHYMRPLVEPSPDTPPDTPSDTPRDKSWGDCSVMDSCEGKYVTRFNCVGPFAQALLMAMLTAILRKMNERGLFNETTEFLKAMIKHLEYGAVVQSSVQSMLSKSFCYFMHMNNDSPPPSQLNKRYIKYVGVVDFNALGLITDFVYGEIDTLSIDTITKAIRSICAMRDDKLDVDNMEYMDAFGTFISISTRQLEDYLAEFPPDENGLSNNGGVRATEYFNVLYFTNIEKWDIWDEEESDGDGEEESSDGEEESSDGEEESDGYDSEEERWWPKK